MKNAMNKLNGWQRIGVVFSTLWLLLTTTLFGVPKFAETPHTLTLNIAGRDVSIDEKFLSLSTEQQEATVDEIAKSLAPKSGPWTKYADEANRSDTLAKSDGSAQRSGMFDDLIAKATILAEAKKQKAANDEAERLQLRNYLLVTTIPIVLLWVSGYAIAWIIAGFRKDRAGD